MMLGGAHGIHTVFCKLLRLYKSRFKKKNSSYLEAQDWGQRVVSTLLCEGNTDETLLFFFSFSFLFLLRLPTQLCNGNMDEKFRLEVWDEDMVSSPDMIGWLDVSLNELLKKVPLKLNDRPGGQTADPGLI